MFFKLSSLVFSLALGLAASGAQAEIALDTLVVRLWPEYDRPSTLVILDGQLDPSVALPAQLEIRLPKAAGGPHAVAVLGPGQQLLDASYTTSEVGEAIMVKFETEYPAFRVEYYDPALTLDGEARSYVLNWQTDYAVDRLAVEVQQPHGASELTTDPRLEQSRTSEDGLTYHGGLLGALGAGQRVELRLNYRKPDSTLTAEAFAAELSGSNDPPAAAPAGNGAPAWLIGAVASVLGLLAVAGAWYWRSRGGEVARPAVRGPCAQCGQAPLAGDRFCRNCGAKLDAP